MSYRARREQRLRDPWADVDGRGNAPAGTPQYPALLRSYKTRPPWKVAGVDYKVGIDRALYPTNANLKSAASGTLPSGAARSGNQINITSNNVVMDGWDFSVGTGWTLEIVSGSGHVISNCNFGYTTTFNNLSIDQPATNITVTKCEFLGSTTDGLVGRGLIEVTAFNTTITYCLVKDAYAIGLLMASQVAASPITLVWKYNVLENAGCGRAASGGAVHGDWVQQYNWSTAAGNPETGIVTSQTYSFSLWLQSMSVSTADTQGLSLHSANTAQGPSLLDHVDNCVMICNSVGHVESAVIMYPPNLNGTGTIRNNYFDLSSASGGNIEINIDPEFNPTGQPGHGAFSGTVNVLGNLDMTTNISVVP